MAAEAFKHENLAMSLLEKKDLELLRQHRNGFDTWSNLTDSSIISAVQQENWYQKVSNDPSKGYFIAYHWVQNLEYCMGAREDIGLIRIDEIDHINRSARVGCDVFQIHRNKGYGTQIMEMIKSYCFDFLNIRRLWLLVAEYNKPARKIYEKVGFRTEGQQKEALYKNGQYYDYVTMSFLKRN